MRNEPRFPGLAPAVIRSGYDDRRLRLSDAEGDSEGFVLPFGGRVRIGPTGLVGFFLVVIVVVNATVVMGDLVMVVGVAVVGIVVMLPGVGVEVKKPRASRAVAVPVEGGVGSEAQKNHRRHHHHRRPEPSHTPDDPPTKTPHPDRRL